MRISSSKLQHLEEEAKLVSLKAYSPYSGLQIGAALLTQDNKIITGCNIENASYGLTICAERVAIGNAISAGIRVFDALVIYCKTGLYPPCGACRQVLHELAPKIEIILLSDNQTKHLGTIDELLPHSFNL